MISKFYYLFATTIPKGEVKTLPKAEINNEQLQSILGAVFGIAGALAVVFIVLGGIRYAISQGNASDLQKAKDMIVFSLVGLVFVISAFTIVQLVTVKLF